MQNKPSLLINKISYLIPFNFKVTVVGMYFILKVDVKEFIHYHGV